MTEKMHIYTYTHNHNDTEHTQWRNSGGKTKHFKIQEFSGEKWTTLSTRHTHSGRELTMAADLRFVTKWNSFSAFLSPHNSFVLLFSFYFAFCTLKPYTPLPTTYTHILPSETIVKPSTLTIERIKPIKWKIVVWSRSATAIYTIIANVMNLLRTKALSDKFQLQGMEEIHLHTDTDKPYKHTHTHPGTHVCKVDTLT